MPGASNYGPLLDALRGVTWPARRVTRGGSAGTHRSRRLGVSPEFTEYRPYRQGDDPRRLDWKLLARTDRAYQRVTTDRATLATAFVIDASASMAFPLATLGKWEQACRVVIGLATVAHAGGDSVGLIVPTPDGARQLAGRTRRGVVGEMARLLESIAPAGDEPLSPAMASARRASRMVVVSDFLGDAEPLLRVAREHVGSGGEWHAVHIVAREELDPGDAAILATDPEQPFIKRALVDDTRVAYRDAFAAFRATLAREWRAAGVSFTEVAADERTDSAVRRIARGGAGDAGRDATGS